MKCGNCGNTLKHNDTECSNCHATIIYPNGYKPIPSLNDITVRKNPFFTIMSYLLLTTICIVVILLIGFYSYQSDDGSKFVTESENVLSASKLVFQMNELDNYDKATHTYKSTCISLKYLSDKGYYNSKNQIGSILINRNESSFGYKYTIWLTDNRFAQNGITVNKIEDLSNISKDLLSENEYNNCGNNQADINLN